jgi:ribosomal protein S18 acetylase RimI-like enzyme
MLRIKIRPFVQGDFPYCNQLTKKNMGLYFHKYGNTWNAGKFKKSLDEGIARVLIVDNRRHGFFHLTIRDGAGYINTIQVSRKLHGKGYGTALMGEIENLFKKKHLTKIQLTVFEHNPAKDLYVRLGFKVLKKKEYKIVMQKLL